MNPSVSDFNPKLLLSQLWVLIVSPLLLLLLLLSLLLIFSNVTRGRSENYEYSCEQEWHKSLKFQKASTVVLYRFDKIICFGLTSHRQNV